MSDESSDTPRTLLRGVLQNRPISHSVLRPSRKTRSTLSRSEDAFTGVPEAMKYSASGRKKRKSLSESVMSDTPRTLVQNYLKVQDNEHDEQPSAKKPAIQISSKTENPAVSRLRRSGRRSSPMKSKLDESETTPRTYIRGFLSQASVETPLTTAQTAQDEVIPATQNKSLNTTQFNRTQQSMNTADTTWEEFLAPSQDGIRSSQAEPGRFRHRRKQISYEDFVAGVRSRSQTNQEFSEKESSVFSQLDSIREEDDIQMNSTVEFTQAQSKADSAHIEEPTRDSAQPFQSVHEELTNDHHGKAGDSSRADSRTMQTSVSKTHSPHLELDLYQNSSRLHNLTGSEPIADIRLSVKKGMNQTVGYLSYDQTTAELTMQEKRSSMPLQSEYQHDQDDVEMKSYQKQKTQYNVTVDLADQQNEGSVVDEEVSHHQATTGQQLLHEDEGEIGMVINDQDADIFVKDTDTAHSQDVQDTHRSYNQDQSPYKHDNDGDHEDDNTGIAVIDKLGNTSAAGRTMILPIPAELSFTHKERMTMSQLSREFVPPSPGSSTFNASIDEGHRSDHDQSMELGYSALKTPLLPPRTESRVKTDSRAAATLSTLTDDQAVTITKQETRDITSKQASRLQKSTRSEEFQNSEGVSTRRNRKKKTGVPSLPHSLIRSIFTHFYPGRVSRDTMEEIQKVSDEFWKNVCGDVTAYAKHACRRKIEAQDVELLMKRQGFVNDKHSVFSLVEKYLPLEYRQEIIPIARSGNNVYPK